MNLRRNHWLGLTVAMLTLPGGLPVAAAAPQKPNIVFIMADDLGWTDTATYGSGYYETPNIDRLAAQGMKFTAYHVAQNCQPTRAALMTGQYAPRTGVYTVGGINRFDWSMRPLRPVDNVTALPLDKVTIASSLKRAGYVTGMFGKWHLGDDDAHHPGRRGFDEAISVSTSGHFDFTTKPPTSYPKGQYLADFLTDKAEDFIRRHKDEPFFLYLTHFAVHAPHQAKPAWVDHFKPKPAAGGHHDPTYAGMIASVDESVGRITRLLDELKLSGRTLLIFTSDNGGVGGYEREDLGKNRGDITDNAPLRHGKGSLYEGGTRVPLIVRWPGNIREGAVCDEPIIHVDMYPTFLELAGTKPQPDQVLDGESLMPLLFQSAPKLKRSAIYQHFPGYLGQGANRWRTTPVGTIISGQWKLLEFFEDGRLELYNLKDDLGEKQNLAQKMPEKTKELHQQLAAWRKDIKAPMPQKQEPGANPVQPAKKRGGKKAAKATADKNDSE